MKTEEIWQVSGKELVSMIEKGLFQYVASNLGIFTGLDKEVALELIKIGWHDLVANNLDKFIGRTTEEHKEIAMEMAKFTMNRVSNCEDSKTPQPLTGAGYDGRLNFTRKASTSPFQYDPVSLHQQIMRARHLQFGCGVKI